MEKYEMDENKRLAIALGAPTVLLLGGLLGGGVSGGGSPPASVALSEATESFSTQLTADQAAESSEGEMDPEVEKILYPYRKTKETETPASAPTPTSEAATTEVISSPDSTEVAETTTLKPIVEEPTGLGKVDPEPANPPMETASIEPEPEPASESASFENVAVQDPVAEVAEAPTEVPTDPEPASAPAASDLVADEPEASDLDESIETVEETAELSLAESVADPVPPAPTPETAPTTAPETPDATEELLTEDIEPAMASPPPAAAESEATTEIAATEPVESEPASTPEPVASVPVTSDPVTSEPADALTKVPSVPDSTTIATPVSYKPESAKEETGSVAKSEKKPFLGVGFRDPSKSIVTTLYGGSAAQQMGIMLGDEIVSANGTKISDMASLRDLLKSLSAGDKVSIQIERGKETFDLRPHPLGSK